MNPDNIKLKDIKPLIMINSDGLYYIIILSIIIFIVIIIAIYFFIKWYHNHNRLNIRKDTFLLLSNIDFNNSKKAAYDITKFGYIFKDDTLRNSEMYENLIERLNKYKYKIKVDNIDEETKSYFELYKEMIDV